MISDGDSDSDGVDDSNGVDADTSEAVSPGDTGESGEVSHVVRQRDPSQLTSEERALLARYAQDRPPHWE